MIDFRAVIARRFAALAREKRKAGDAVPAWWKRLATGLPAVAPAKTAPRPSSAQRLAPQSIRAAERDAFESARAAERSRWAAVLASPEAKGRASLACSLLADTGMGVAKVRAMLAATPIEHREGLAERMATVPRPDIGSGPSRSAEAATSQGQAAQMIAAYNKATGSDGRG